MSAQNEFIGNFKSVLVHLIKHDRRLYMEFDSIIEALDSDGWNDYTLEQKKAAVSDVRDKIPRLDAYYSEYPHNWSRDRYEEFKTALDSYERELVNS